MFAFISGALGTEEKMTGVQRHRHTAMMRANE
jgi:hypothetical protein